MAAYHFISSGNCASTGARLSDENPLAMPEAGSYGLRVLSPTLLELTLITTKEQGAAVSTWNFVNSDYSPNLPPASQFAVTANSQTIPASAVGFKRRPIYAPLKTRDLRIGNQLYLKLASAIPDGAAVEVKNPGGGLWSAPVEFSTTNDAMRFNPAIHVNGVGYMPGYPKKAMVGYYLGNLGEMEIPTAGGFKIVDANSGAVVFSGMLRQRRDVGYTYSPAPYQLVYEADFSAFTTPGEYRLQVPGMGASYAFMINEGVSATFARTFALGLYHQRCGTALGVPFTRHDHGACHTNPVEIPTMEFADVNSMLAGKTSDAKSMPRHTAPALANVNASLYPFVRQGKIDVSKGHHDAGDYSKYTINSAGLIHFLTFAADSFGNAGNLDNLGIPESGDGRSDLLQEAKWEADYLAKMQDSDGGFYFLTYPKTREYEDDVTPDHGDPQVVWPKTTAVTAAATAALAEIGSSPKFKQQFPAEAALYMQKAQAGWNFLTGAIGRFGKDGSYQKITHYGNEFMHDDELAWAAAAMFAATGDAAYLAKLKEWLPDPNATSIRRWDWWRMFEGYGCAIRTYAFAARSGRVPASALDLGYLAKCDREIQAAADDIVRFSNQTAYGTSFPDPSKNYRSAGWYFSSERAFDITVAHQLTPTRADYREAVFANLNYEGGCNPVNMSFVTGLGWKRQRDVVHQHAQNDRQVLPPSGIPQGNVVGGVPYMKRYEGELGPLVFPAENATSAPYPYYDRVMDAFDTTAEFVVMDQARSLASLAYWMSQSGVANQSWKSAMGTITGLPAEVAVDSVATVSLNVPGVDLSGAQVVWEVKNLQPGVGLPYRFSPKYSGETWVEAEALLPDGRRIFAKTNFVATTSVNTPANAFQSAPVTAGGDTAAIYHLDNNLTEANGRQGALTLAGNARMDTSNLAWLKNRSGAALRFTDLGDQGSVSIPAASIVSGSTEFISVEAMICVNAFKAYNKGLSQILSLGQAEAARVAFREDMYIGPMFQGGSVFEVTGATVTGPVKLNEWHHLSLRLDKSGYTIRLNGNVIASKAAAGELAKWSATGSPVVLRMGDFDGWIDEVVVRSSTVAGTGVGGNTAPTVSLSASASTAIAPGSVILSAAASDSDGISKVEFYNGANKLGEATAAPYSFAWTAIPAGVYTLTARATDTLGLNANSTAILFSVAASTGDGGGGASNTNLAAAFVKTDAATRGNWRGVYGSEGYTIIGDGELAPAYGGATPGGAENYTWANSTSDARALQKADGTDRIASVWHASDSFNIDFNFTDVNTHRVSLYVMDWDHSNRAQRFEVIDPANGNVLSASDVSDFAEGKYLTWDLRGKVRLRVSRTAGNNAIVEGLFYDSTPKLTGNGALKLKGKNAAGALLEVSGAVGTTYKVQSTTDLTNWSEIGSVTLQSATQEFIDTNSLPGFRIYRLAN